MLDISHRTITLRLRFLIALEKMLLVREDRWHFLLPGASGWGCDFGGQSYCGVSAARNACRLMGLKWMSSGWLTAAESGRKWMALGWLKAAELVGNLGSVEVNRVGAEWCWGINFSPIFLPLATLGVQCLYAREIPPPCRRSRKARN